MARDALPIALESPIAVNVNVRAMRWFCELRGAVDNVPEIRAVACLFLQVLQRYVPSVVVGFRESVGDDGFPIVVLDPGVKGKV